MEIPCPQLLFFFKKKITHFSETRRAIAIIVSTKYPDLSVLRGKVLAVFIFVWLAGAALSFIIKY